MKLSDFLGLKGAFDILFKLGEKERSFNELEKILNLSPNTVLARIREARNLGLVEEKLFGGNGRSKIKYVLTKKGKDVLGVSDSLKEDYLALRGKIDKLEEERKEKEMEIKELLSSLQSSQAIIRISGSRVTKKGKGDLVIRAETETRNASRQKVRKEK